MSVPPRYRIGALAEKTGTSRETIHFYLRRGLLPKPQKGGRTSALYGDEHVERLRTIRRLREEKYLPLAVIGELLAGPAGAAQDASVLADLLRLDPHVAEVSARPPPSRAARAEAQTRGLFPQRADAEGSLAEVRVLGLVDEVLALPPVARSLTLTDFGYCAEELGRLVTREAGLFFDHVLVSGDVTGSLDALRAGRGAVARFITAYRDLLLHGIVLDLVAGLAAAHDLAANAVDLPLSTAAVAALGGRPKARSGSAPFVAFVLGDGAFLEKLAGRTSAAARALGAHARCVRTGGATDELGAHAAESALGQVLLGETLLARALVRKSDDASVIEPVVAALGFVVSARPEDEAEADARALAFHRAGRVELALPAVLGRRERGVGLLGQALEHGERASPLVRAHVLANASLSLAEALDAAGRMGEASELRARALALDPGGPIGEACQRGPTR
jgi:DNA-binding transcriptional MerR regulator